MSAMTNQSFIGITAQAAKAGVKGMLVQDGYEVQDFGCHSAEGCDYPDLAVPAAVSVADGDNERGILICGTGLGMSIAANKIGGIRAALCHDELSAQISRHHNDANVLCLGERVTGPGVAEEIVKTWLNTPFGGGRHQRRIELFS